LWVSLLITIMRVTRFIIFAFVALTSCGPIDTNEKNGGPILFVIKPVQSPFLLVKPTLRCSTTAQTMELSITFKNVSQEPITINEVSFNNPNGLHTSLEAFAHNKLIVNAGEDTTLLTTFEHINDKKLFHDTGLPGLLDSAYVLSVFYTIEGKEGTRVINLRSTMPEKKFLSYRKAHEIPLQLYVLNTANGFDESQRQFLLSGNVTATSPFVHMTEQEIAISGLNFRVRCFHMKASLYTEVFAVNHSEMTVTLDTSKIHMMVDALPVTRTDATLNIEKVTGSKQDVTVLGKGDRVIIKMQKKGQQPPRELLLLLSESVLLPDGRPLFKDDVSLVRAPELR
jgi:hypothetical protein